MRMEGARRDCILAASARGIHSLDPGSMNHGAIAQTTRGARVEERAPEE